MRFPHKVIILEKGLREHLNALNPGIGLSGKLGNSSLLLRGLGINCSKRSLEKENIENYEALLQLQSQSSNLV